MAQPDIKNPFLRLKARYLFVWSLVILLLLGIGSGLLAPSINLNLNDPILFPILYTLFFAILCLYLAKLGGYQLDLGQVLGRQPSQQQWVTYIAFVPVLLLFSLSAFFVSFYLVSWVAPDFVESILQEKLLEPESQTIAPFLYKALTIISLVVVAPIAEEFIFRGILLQRWAVKWDTRSALLASSLIFGILHANILGLTIFGLMMGLFYIKTRSLFVPIICHALNNLLALSLELFSPESSDAAIDSVAEFRSGWWVGVLLLAISAPWIVRFIYKNFPGKNAPIPYFANSNRNGVLE
jgi:uncharacterized protein